MSLQKFKDVAFVIILWAVCVGIGYGLNEIIPLKENLKEVHDTITTPGDKVFVQVYNDVPTPVRTEVAVHDTIRIQVDTAEILERYFARLYYCDTIRSDTSIRAIIKEIISQNKIVHREVWTQNLRPHQVIHQTTIINPTGWYLGPHVSFGDHIGIGAGAFFLKNKNAYGGSIDLLNRTIGVSYYRKL